MLVIANFTEARLIVANQLRPTWNNLAGDFHVAEWGWENDQYWQLAAGSKEFLVDGDFDFAMYDDLVYLVDKETGKFSAVIAYEAVDLLDTFTQFGKFPKFI